MNQCFPFDVIILTECPSFNPQKKDEEMAWLDSCCLQLVVRGKSGKEETYTFQTDNPNVKKEWMTELRLAQLALDTNNSPAWDVSDQQTVQRPLTKMPLFVKAQVVRKAQHQTEVSVQPLRVEKCNWTDSIFLPLSGTLRLLLHLDQQQNEWPG